MEEAYIKALENVRWSIIRHQLGKATKNDVVLLKLSDTSVLYGILGLAFGKSEEQVKEDMNRTTSELYSRVEGSLAKGG